MATARSLWLALLCACAFAHAEPDELALGRARGYPAAESAAGMAAPQYRVGSWSALDTVPGVQVHRVAASPSARPLPRAAHPPPIRYRLRNAAYTLDDYLERQRITALMILKNGEIVAERYRYGRAEHARFLGFSMSKSIVSLLVGVAAANGSIASLDDPASKYAKELAGSAYGDVTIRELLRMSSGLTFTERYDGRDDVARMSRAFAGPEGTVPVLRSIVERHSPPGEKFVYASAESEALGRVLHGASGRSLAELTEKWLWQPLGAGDDAFWRVGGDGMEGAWGYFNASLADWARVGLLLVHDGRVGERQVVPRDYLLDATDTEREPEAFRPRRATPYTGYGYQFWLMPMRERTFALQGVYGQAIFVQPASGIVLVQLAVYDPASAKTDPVPFRERDAFWRGVLQSLGGSTE
ncbi:MAG TPA: serine hydrolase [Ramlibacter sp.]|uniref:serine hydrolase domain-containing protein n=1 Tax=Ramlibacter sp. TaxID=1917967 RepID=UPI002BF5DDF4|nr:serine hydrolase [Ramlibacter sp.]HVZ42566.1 serine hydrolase [Ramlibacter sp.]